MELLPGEVFGYLDSAEMATGLQVSWGLVGMCLSLPGVLFGKELVIPWKESTAGDFRWSYLPFFATLKAHSNPSIKDEC